METQTFVVGGAVRDKLLGRVVKDIDYVVVGATPEYMLESGFQQVGADFPVFLDSQGAEWALARTERKTSSGYNGFETQYDTSVTLEDDLYRRDLTVNAMAVRLEDWREFKITKNTDFVIDPFGGLNDLANGLLKHVSEAFAEDPVRVLRVARFAARYDFIIDGETLNLMQQLVDSGELDTLTQERVYAEFEKAMMEDNPIMFLEVLGVVGAGGVLFPELFTDDRLPLMINESMERGALLSSDLLNRMVILTAGLETESVQVLFERLKAPKEVTKLLKMSCKLVERVMKRGFDGNIPEDVVGLLSEVNAWSCCKEFRTVMAVFSVFDNHWLNNMAFVLLKSWKAGKLARFDLLTDYEKKTLQGAEISEAINELRIELVNEMMHG